MSKINLIASTDTRLGLPSCSNLHIYINCPGSIQAIASATPLPVSPIAEFGTVIHESISHNDDPEMAPTERHSYVVNSCRKIENKLVTEIFGSYDDLMVWVETRFWMHDVDGNKILSGQADKVFANKSGRFLILDFKSLPGAVDDVEENWQLGGLATVVSDDSTMRGDYQVEEIFCAIVQPLVSQTPTVVRFSLTDLVTLRRRIIHMLQMAGLPNSPRWPGVHCKYCSARAECPQAAALPVLWASPNLSVSTLQPDQIEELIPKLPVIESIIEAIRDRAKLLAANNQLPNYEMKERNGRLLITDLKAARSILEPFVSKEDFNKLITISTGALRTLFTDTYSGQQRVTRAEAGKKFMELLASASEREAPTHMLAKRKGTK